MATRRITLSRLGLGCVTFGREIPAPDAFALMDSALARGITHFDTAAAYGGGASETIVGQWFAQRQKREAITLATKLLPPYTPDRLESEFAASLSRLGTASVEILYLHRWDDTLLAPEALAALDALIERGSVGALAISNVSQKQLEALLSAQARSGTRPVRFVQNNHNFAVRDAGPEFRSYCKEHGVTVVTYSPLGAGFLSGKHLNGVQAGSRFDLVPAHQSIYFTESSQARLKRLIALAQGCGVSPAQAAMAWALHQEGVGSVLIGARTVTQLDQAFDPITREPRVIAAVLGGSEP